MGWRSDEFGDDPRFASIVKNLLETLDIRERIGARSPWFAVLMVAGTLAVLAGVLWYSYPKESAEKELRAVPIVRADAGPMKIVPGDPGGMDIPYRDSTVFETLRTTDNKTGPERIENLLPESEKPLPREELFAGLKTDLKSSPLPMAVTGDLNRKPENDSLKGAVATHAATKPEPDQAKAANAAAKIEPASGTPKGDYFVQLGSLRSRAEAEKAWKDNQTAFPAQLADIDLRIQEADLGAKGIYYRVQGGPMNQADAAAICRTVEARKPGGCLVIRH